MNKKSIIAAAFMSLCCVIVFSCAKDKAKPEDETPDPVACGTVTYEQDIKPLIAAKCSDASCHPAQTPINSYQDASARADRIKIRTVDQNPSPMPPTNSPMGPLSEDQKQLIKCWLETGKKEN